ncbi:MAG: GNAT family N-acetyltransferase [Bacteroidales bacterium]|nr:GNAT family N-acetyltransferase [Bacteroidales bacterium]
MKIILQTPYLEIRSASIEDLLAAIEGDDCLEKQLDAEIPSSWTEFGSQVLRNALHKIKSDDSEKGWWTYFPIHRMTNMLIGSGGYKGKPDKKGVVEIGYEITPLFRGKGLATEMAEALVKNAFTYPDVRMVIAHTLAKENASTHILQKLGFRKVKEFEDPEDGVVWRWELRKA